MHLDLILSNLLTPAVLFFFLGMFAVWFRSDLDIPQPIPKLLSLYLLFAIGFRGGVELAHSGFTGRVMTVLLVAVAISMVVPMYTFAVLRRRLDTPNAGAIAATYGSVSAVTFIAATSLLGTLGIPFGGHMVAALALMESPAIILGILLVRAARKEKAAGRIQLGGLAREAFLNGSVYLLIGSLAVGMATGESGAKALSPFTDGVFKGVLCLFLLDMGIVSARRAGAMRALGVFPFIFAIGVPLLNGAIGIGLAMALGLSRGDAFLLTTLCASASYIAVPAAMRHAVPEANPGLYVTMALAITFPFNIVLGLPMYLSIIDAIWR